MNRFFGTGVAMVTPFNADREVDYKGLKNLINYLIEGGVEYLVSLGTTGESATLNKDEKKAVWEFTAEVVNGRLPLIAGIGGNDTREIAKEVSGFRIPGYEAILSVSPYYNKPTQEGMYQHYKTVAEASSLPVILYNVPGRTGSNLAPDTTLRLAHDFKNIIAVKEASGNFDQFNQILKDKPEDFLFISGDDAVTLPLVAMGGAGIISVVANAVPKQFSEMVRHCLSGDFKQGRKLHYNLLPLTSLLFAEGNPGGIKSALQHLDICRDIVRLPLVGVGSKTSAAIKEELQRLELAVQ